MMVMTNCFDNLLKRLKKRSKISEKSLTADPFEAQRTNKNEYLTNHHMLIKKKQLQDIVALQL